MGKDHKKDRKSRRRSPSPSSSSASSDSSRSRSRSRSRDRSSHKRKHASSSSRRSRSRSRSPRDRKKSRRNDSRDGDRSRSRRDRSRTRSRSPDRKPVKRERRSRSRSRSREDRSVKRETLPVASAAFAASSGPSAFDLKRIKEEEKARLKASETPAERLARRQAKKAAKAALKGGGGAGGSSGAVAAPSAFGDGGSKPFIWKKKYEKSIEEGLDPQILSREQLAAKQAALAEEIEAIKARKIARAEEKAQMEELREQMAREAEAENIEGWEEKEEEFHRHNAALRTQLRIAEGREKCIDVLAKNRALFKKLVAGPTPEELEEHPEWDGAALDPNLDAAKDIELTEPHRMFTSGELPWRDLEFLAKDIEEHVQLGEKQDEAYWNACAQLCRAAIVRQKTAAFAPGAAAAAARQFQGRFQQPPPVPARPAPSAGGSVKDDIALLLRGKTLMELESLERDVGLLLSGSPQASAALRALSEGLDHSYWESVLKELQQFKHIAYLREFHVELLRSRLRDLQRYVLAEEARDKERRAAARAERIAAAGGDPSAVDGDLRQDETEGAGLYDGEDEAELNFEPALIPHDQFEGGEGDDGREDDGSFSPVLVPDDEEEPSAATAAAATAPKPSAIDADTDAAQLAEARRLVAEQKQREMEERAKMAAGSAVSAPTALVPAGAAAAAAAGGGAANAAGDAAYRREAGRGVEADEVQLRSEFTLPSQTYWFADKYRPRKPRFFNRVKTGFEWNKYNGTHYDKENPPPKIVQGYKFNIFYPDLIDPSTPPRFRLEPDPSGNPDFQIIRFMAGPPYEDLAFKIVRKEWEYSFKRGYKCVFDRGVLALYFNFRRYFYRR